MNAVLLWSVPPGVRPLAMSLSVVATHLLGDVPSPPLLGLLQGWLRNWRCAAACAVDGLENLKASTGVCWSPTDAMSGILNYFPTFSRLMGPGAARAA
jgi:hypothetical protein